MLAKLRNDLIGTLGIKARRRPDGMYVARMDRGGATYEGDPKPTKREAEESCWQCYLGGTQRPNNSEGI